MGKRETTDNELTREERLDIESQAIDALLEMGVKFSVPLKIRPKDEPKFHRWVRTHLRFLRLKWRDRRLPESWNVTVAEVPDTETMQMERVYRRNFHVRPLYLGTNDFLRKLYMQIEYDEGAVQEKPIEEGFKQFKYTDLMSKIAAVAIVNKPEVADPLGSREVMEIARFLRTQLTVARLQKLCSTIKVMMNTEGFINSIRLIKGLGTTIPKAAARAGLVE